jgi:hypothetical protein
MSHRLASMVASDLAAALSPASARASSDLAASSSPASARCRKPSTSPRPTNSSISCSRANPLPASGLGGAAAVGADQDRCAKPMFVWDLRIGHGDVVGGGVRVHVPGPQHPRQRLPDVVQPGEQRVIAKPMLERGRADAPPTLGDSDLRIRRDTLHLTGAFLVNRPLNRGKSRIGHRQGTLSYHRSVSRPRSTQYGNSRARRTR